MGYNYSIYPYHNVMGFKYEVNENFFQKWSNDMAYVLGFLYADGSLEDSPYIRGKYVRVSSIDKEPIEFIKSSLQAHHPITIIQPRYLSEHQKYFLRIGSHKIYDSLTSKGLYPRKSLTIAMPNIPAKYLRHFIRGYFDGDGCATIERTKDFTKVLFAKRLRTSFTSGSRHFLEQLSSVLAEHAQTSSHKVYDSHRSHQLCYSTADSICLFKFLYANLQEPLYLSRKFAIFKQYFTLRPEKVDLGIKRILYKA